MDAYFAEVVALARAHKRGVVSYPLRLALSVEPKSHSKNKKKVLPGVYSVVFYLSQEFSLGDAVMQEDKPVLKLSIDVKKEDVTHNNPYGFKVLALNEKPLELNELGLFWDSYRKNADKQKFVSQLEKYYRSN